MRVLLITGDFTRTDFLQPYTTDCTRDRSQRNKAEHTGEAAIGVEGEPCEHRHVEGCEHAAVFYSCET